MFQHADQTQIQFPRLVARNDQAREPSPEYILNTVAEYFRINGFSMKSRRLSESLRVPRQMAIYLCLQWTSLSYSEIGQFFAGRHGSTIRRHCLEIQKSMRDNVFIHATITDISRKILR